MKTTFDQLHTTQSQKSVLVIYTGGTFGMCYDSTNQYLVPVEFDNLVQLVPELKRFTFNIDLISWNTLIDSADMNPEHWNLLTAQIQEYAGTYDGFVILHGTDTMAYTASALSFMIQGLQKPIIITGAQLPIGEIRNDARGNFLSALEIASQNEVKEVCIYFHDDLLRGNRTVKVKSADFRGFASPNYPLLGKAGIEIDYSAQFFLGNAILKQQFQLVKDESTVFVLKLFPGIGVNVLQAVLNTEGLQALVLETYGSGTCNSSFVEALGSFIEKDGIVVAVSQCLGGKVKLGKYESSQLLSNIGVLSANDMTTESTTTKLMFLLSNYSSSETRTLFEQSISGEVSYLDKI